MVSYKVVYLTPVEVFLITVIVHNLEQRVILVCVDADYFANVPGTPELPSNPGAHPEVDRGGPGDFQSFNVGPNFDGSFTPPSICGR